MSEALGIHISERGIVAVLADAEGDDDPVVLELGEQGPAAAVAVASGADGAVLVGDAAARADGPVVTDPLERARQGRTGALTAVITHVTGRAATTVGSAPTRLAVVVGDDFAADDRDQVVLAANGAGISDVTIVFETLARTRHADVAAIAAVAAGAALTASVAAPPPIVTREDLGGTMPAVPIAPPTIEPTSGPVSVFDEERESAPQPRAEPVRASPAEVASTPVTGSVPPVPPPDHGVPERRFPVWAGVAVAIVVLLGAGLAGFFVFGSDDGSDVVLAASSTTTSTSTTTTSTTEAPTSTSTTSTTSTSSTSTTSTTSTSSTSTTSTTSTPLRVGTPGPVTLVETGLQFDTNVVVQFGQDSEIVLLEAAAVLGDPDDDTGFVAHEFCAGTRSRFVRWGDLELVFTEEDADTNVGNFSQWYVDGHATPTGLVTLDGLGESATVGFLEVTYGDALAIVAAFEGDTAGIFAVTNPGTGGVLSGTTEGLHPEGVVTTLWAGDSCTRAFT